MKKKVILTMVVLTVVALLFPGFVHGAIPAAERAALIALYNSTNGDSWTDKTGWKTPPLHTDGFAMPGTEKRWKGVIVSGDHVIEIIMLENQLSGTIPAELGNLSNLEWLSLYYNQLSGSIPAQLGNLSNLKGLDLWRNQLSGSIPAQLGNLSNLESLSLGNNQLSGSIPSQLGNLSNLERLVLDNNQLSGTIPAQLGNLSNLEYLDLGGNQLSGSIPSQLGNLSNLKYLYLFQNQLSGSIPAQLGNLSNLEELYLSTNQLSGSIPSQLGNLSNLKVLTFWSNQLSGSIPSQLGNLCNLAYLSLDFNQLTGSIPSQLGNLSNLKALSLLDNQLSGSIPVQLINLSQLIRLDLAQNQLSGSIPSQLGNLSNLAYLSLAINQLSGSIPSQLGNLSNLKELYLYGNQLSGSIPAELGNLSNLEYLDLGGNQLSGSIPSQLGNLSNLKGLYLYRNQLSGSILSQLGNINNLIELSLTHNQLSGSIPSQLGNLSNLERLVLNNNRLSGSIPSSFTNLTKIPLPNSAFGDLDVGYNCLSATDSTLRAWLNEHDPDWEAHQDQCGSVTAVIALSRANLYFGINGHSSTGAQTVLIGNSGSGTLNWNAAANVSWLSLNPSSGTGESVLAVSVDPTGLAAGTYSGAIIITAPNASNSPQSISVRLHVYKTGTTAGPFGEFATPLEGSSTYSSIPVTGWALDDIGIAGVKIYNGDAYVGDAVFVEGARSDVELAYPGYPNNYKAGWGYMMLSHFLPGGGNGTYTLVAKATDMEGNEVTLGTRTITIDNAHAVKPFGAIDTPGQGGTATGGAYRNQGWVLTPQPNNIPTDGSTIAVWVDGVKKGHLTYNIYRPDVAALFPGLANSNGAAGYFTLDTTAYGNGIHTIQWTAKDSAGNTDGIGSRYFTVQNTGSREQAATAGIVAAPGDVLIDFDTIPTRYSEPLTFNKGFSDAGCREELPPDEKGMYLLVSAELERVEIRLGENFTKVQGFLLMDNQLNRLPVGSTVDAKAGTFYWSPGPGFLGRYSLVFVLTEPNGETFKKFIDIEIEPKFNGIQ